MKLPQSLSEMTEWTIVGPMGTPAPEEFLSRPVLAIDGGADHTPRLDVWVGDADSVKNGPTGPLAFHHPPEKNLSDLALGLGLFPPGRKYRLHLWGLLGGRLDHELFNLGEALSFLETRQGSEIIFYESAERVALQLFGAGTWSLNFSGVFSLGSAREVRLRLTGDCAYPIPQLRPLQPLSSLGLSNRATGNISLYNEGPVFFYFPEKT